LCLHGSLSEVGRHMAQSHRSGDHEVALDRSMQVSDGSSFGGLPTYFNVGSFQLPILVLAPVVQTSTVGHGIPIW
jgi:hypothetical protein